MDVSRYNELGAFVKEKLNLRTSPIAVKFCETSEEIPEEAVLPYRDLGKHAAFCQAKAMARMRGMTVAMGKEDHWCWNPIVGFGVCPADVGEPAGDKIVEFLGIQDKEKAEEFWTNFPRLEVGKYPYVVVAPIEKCSYEPDIILVYSNTQQVVWEIGAVRYMTGEYIDSSFDSIDSCIHAIVEPFKSRKYKVTFPDPGDRARANAREDEVIMSIPSERWEEFCTGIEKTEFMYNNYLNELGIETDNEVPPFYHELFQIWGLEEKPQK